MLAFDYQGKVLQDANSFWEPPEHRCVHCNGHGPTFWVLISVTLLKAIREEGFGTNFCRAIGSIQIIFVAYAFINNTDLIQTMKNECENINSITYQRQEAADLWSASI